MEYLYKTELDVKRDSNGNIIYKNENPYLNEFKFYETYVAYIVFRKAGKYEYGKIKGYPFGIEFI